MSQLDVLKLLQRYGDETALSDFTPDELKEMLDTNIPSHESKLKGNERL